MEVHQQLSGHDNFEPLLTSPYIDGFASPISYYDRNEGGLGGYMAPVHSVQSYGKIWFIESDIRGFSNPDEQDASYNPPVKDTNGLIEVHRRQIGQMMTSGIGTWWMDLWGSGWLDNNSVWEDIQKQVALYETYTKTLKPASGDKTAFRPDAAVVIDEDGLFRCASPTQMLNGLMGRGVREEIQKAGLTVGYYRTQDFIKGNIPSSVKLFVMPNAWHIDDSEMAAIKKYQKNGNVFLFLSGFGDNSAARIKELTGMTATWQDTVSTSIAVTNSSHTLTKGLSSVCEAFSLYTTYSLSGGTVLGKSGASNTFAVKENEGYKAVYLGGMVPSRNFYRNIARYAGINVYLESDDVITGNHEFISIHTDDAVAGNRIISFGKKVDVFDYYANKWYTGVDKITVNMKAGTTYHYFFGNKSELVKKNIYGVR